MGSFHKGEHSGKGGLGSAAVRMFCNGYENLAQSPNLIWLILDA